MKVKNILIYESWMEIMKSLPSQQVGDLMKAIISWRDGNEPDLSDPVVKGMFMVMSNDLEKMSINYNNKVNANRLNGKKGGAPVGNRNAMKTTQINPNNLKEKEKEKEKDIEKDIDKVSGTNNASTIVFEKIKKPLSTERVKEILEDKDSREYLDTLIKK